MAQTSFPATAAPSSESVVVANRLRPVLLHINRHLRREAQTQGISAGQIAMLSAIADRPGVGVADLAAREGMSPPSVSACVDRLEAGGYATRVRDGAGDRRRVGLAATPAGSALLRRVRSRRTAWLAARLEALAPEERARIGEAVDALAALVAQR